MLTHFVLQGFDPLRLGVDKARLAWFREAELYNGRWAMSAVVGVLFTELASAAVVDQHAQVSSIHGTCRLGCPTGGRLGH